MSNDEMKVWARKLVDDSIRFREHLTCDHCDRQYDDDMCDKCLAKMMEKNIAAAFLKIQSEEKERCAKIAEKEHRKYGLNDESVDAIKGRAIARRIRNQKSEPSE